MDNTFLGEIFSFKKIIKLLKVYFIIIGVVGFIMCIVAFTSLPYNTREWLGIENSEYKFKPDYIIMLGGSGMPSEDNLIRLYYTAEIAKFEKNAKIIITHPFDSAVYCNMKKELLLREIDSGRINFDSIGTNTRSQALGHVKANAAMLNSKVVIVTSPEHMYRSIMVFKKVGFKYVGGYPAFEHDMFVDLTFKGKKLGGRKYVPDVGDNLSMRYNFWNYLKLEIICMREFTAIGYYWINGWI